MKIGNLKKLTVGKSILVVPDAHARPDENQSDFDRFFAVGELILDLRPDAVVCIGDLGDFRSLNQHTAKSATAFDGRAARADLDAFKSALRAITSPTRTANERHKKSRRHDRAWEPGLYFCEGNHEEFWRRYPETQLLGHDHVQKIAESEGWNWAPLGEQHEIDGVLFSHYLTTGTSKKPVGVAQALNKTHRSCVWGHTHTFGFDQKPVLGRGTISAVCAGSYRPPHRTGPHDWSGLVLLNDVRAGSFSIQQISYDTVLELYGSGDHAQRLRAARAHEARDIADAIGVF